MEEKDSDWTESDDREKSISFDWQENAANVAKINEQLVLASQLNFIKANKIISFDEKVNY